MDKDDFTDYARRLGKALERHISIGKNVEVSIRVIYREEVPVASQVQD